MTNQCQKYGIAITDFVLGEEMDIPIEELFNHLKTCETCRKDLADWQNTYAALRTEAYHKKPEAKKRMQELLEKIHALPGPCRAEAGNQIIPPKKEVGESAGIVWKCLAKDGVINLEELPEKTKLSIDQAYAGYGWLAKEDKIVIIHGKKGKSICLTEHERKQSQELG